MKQERGIKTKNKILEKALLCFSKNGFDNTSIKQICSEAGISKGAFYHHFDSKQNLFLELINRWLSNIDKRLENINIKKNNPSEAISIINDAALETFKEASGNVPIFFEIWLRTVRDPEIYRTLIDPYKKYINYFKSLMEESIADKTIKQLNPETTARLIIAMSLGLLLQSYFEKENQDWEKMINEAFMIFTQGILTNER